jgi:hypothetical protein
MSRALPLATSTFLPLKITSWQEPRIANMNATVDPKLPVPITVTLLAIHYLLNSINFLFLAKSKYVLAKKKKLQFYIPTCHGM